MLLLSLFSLLLDLLLLYRRVDVLPHSVLAVHARSLLVAFELFGFSTDWFTFRGDYFGLGLDAWQLYPFRRDESDLVHLWSEIISHRLD